MSDNLKDRGPADRMRVNVHEPWELRWWCQHLEVTPEKLKETVKKVGVMVSDVRRSLGK